MPSPGALRQSRDEVPSVSSQRPCIGPYTWFATESFSGGMLDLVEMGNLSPTSVRWLVRRGSRPPSGDTADVAHTGARRVVSKRWPLTASSRGITLQMAPTSPPQSDLSHAFCLRSAVEVQIVEGSRHGPSGLGAAWLVALCAGGWRFRHLWLGRTSQ
jgi:hypothetical protein